MSLYLVQVIVRLGFLKAESPLLLGRKASKHLVKDMVVAFVFGLWKEAEERGSY